MILQRKNTMTGLTKEDVLASRQQYGENIITHKKRNTFLKQFADSFGDPIIKILLVALAINLLLMIRTLNWFEPIGILVAILLATMVSTISEYGSESAFEKLQEESAKEKCRVKRAEGIIEIPISEVVCNDLVLLQAGERVPADGIIVAGRMIVDQSALNGETKEVEKRPSTEKGKNNNSAVDFMQPNRLFKGSVLCGDEGIMLVEQVGDRTFYGQLAVEVQEETQESPMKVRLRGLADRISKFGYIGAGLVFLAHIFNELIMDNQFNVFAIVQALQDPQTAIRLILDGVTLAVTVIVVAVPEGLPMMITLVLSSNMKRMLKDHVLVRKLVGIETSGSLNILFTDKTGTLTQGKLQVITFLDGEGTIYQNIREFRGRKEFFDILRISAVMNNSASLTWKGKEKRAIGGNATDRAILEYISFNSDEVEGVRKVAAIPFDSLHKFSAVQVEGTFNCSFIKGAPEKILPYCTGFYDKTGKIKSITTFNLLKEEMERLAKKSIRVLAFATSQKPLIKGQAFHDLTLVGLVGMQDEIRPEAVEGVQEVSEAGIQVVMMTGDNKQTAIAIAKESGIILPNQENVVLTSEELCEMEDEEVKERLPDLRVIARALPTDKSRMVRISQELGLVAGMTGDGVNDAPALKKADVGFAMGSGTEVAKEAGDIVILDDNFSSISKAVLYGRTIYKSVRKFITFQLTDNFCAVGLSVIAPFFGIDTPITVIQMLWINMVMDTFAGIAFSGEPPLKEYMQEPPKKREEDIINPYMWNQTIVMGLYTTLLCIFFLKSSFTFNIFGQDYAHLMTGFFALFMYTTIFNSFNARTHRLNLLGNIRKNKLFIVIMTLIATTQIVLIYYGGILFRASGLTFSELKWVFIFAITVVPVDWLRKVYLRDNDIPRGV